MIEDGILSNLRVVDIESGYDSSYALTSEGLLFGWRHNGGNQVKPGDTSDISRPLRCLRMFLSCSLLVPPVNTFSLERREERLDSVAVIKMGNLEMELPQRSKKSKPRKRLEV